MLGEDLVQRKKELEKLVKQIERDLEGAPEGRLRISAQGKRAQYYWIKEKGDTIGQYMKRSEEAVARKLAQRMYEEKLLDAVRVELKSLDNLIGKRGPEDYLGRMFDDLHTQRKPLVNPLVLSDEEYSKIWQQETYVGKDFDEDSPKHYSNRGERVRSKSEETIANIFDELGIPYKYERPVLLDGKFFAYPDFTFLKVKSRRECYLEHFGRMDEATYLKDSFFSKLDTYQRNGIIPGVNLFMTFESKTHPLVARDVRRYIEKIALE